MSGFAYNFPPCSCASPYLLNPASSLGSHVRFHDPSIGAWRL